jgi:transposase-like protein
MEAQEIKGFNNLIEINEYFSDEDICRKYLAYLRWENNPICPHCGHDKVYEYQNGKLYKCAKCRQQFTVKVGTIFEDSKISLKKWFVAAYIITSHKKGISSLQLHRDIGVTQKTAWFMLHRIRYSIRTKSFNVPLSGIIEADETLVGGKEKNKHKDKKTEGTQGRSTKTKTAVFGLLERGGDVQAEVVNDVKKDTLQNIIEEQVKEGSTVVTDEWKAYNNLPEKFEHLTVNHNKGVYVDGIAYTNTLEGFWSLFKRGVIGIYHSISKKHTDKYVDEFEFRYNSRGISEVDRFNLFLQEIQGRLKYKQLIA